MANTILLLQPSADVGSGSLNVFLGPDIHDSSTTAALVYNNSTTANQALLDAAAEAAGYSAGDFTLGGDSGSMTAAGGWTITFQGSLADRNVPPILAYDDSGLASSVSPSATYSAADATYGQSYVAAVSGSPASVTFTFSEDAVDGTYTVNGQSASYNSTPTVSGWTVTGSPAGGSITITSTTDDSTLSEPTVDPSGLVSSETAGTAATFAWTNVDSSSGVLDGGYYTVGGSGDPNWSTGGEFSYTVTSGSLTCDVTGSSTSAPSVDCTTLTEELTSSGLSGQPYQDSGIYETYPGDGGLFTPGTDPTYSYGITASDGSPTTWTPGIDPAAAVPQVDRLLATASGGSLTITTEYGTTAAIPWGPYADSAACCAAVQAAIIATNSGALSGLTVAVNSSTNDWSPTYWDLLITLPVSEGSQTWTVDGSELTNEITVQESVSVAGSGGGGGNLIIG